MGLSRCQPSRHTPECTARSPAGAGRMRERRRCHHKHTSGTQRQSASESSPPQPITSGCGNDLRSCALRGPCQQTSETVRHHTRTSEHPRGDTDARGSNHAPFITWGDTAEAPSGEEAEPPTARACLGPRNPSPLELTELPSETLHSVTTTTASWHVPSHSAGVTPSPLYSPTQRATKNRTGPGALSRPPRGFSGEPSVATPFGTAAPPGPTDPAPFP